MPTPSRQGTSTSPPTPSELHAERGLTATSWEDIAQRAGVSTATVYRHFPSTAELVPACARTVFDLIRPPTLEEAGATFGLLDRAADRFEQLVRYSCHCYAAGAGWLHAAHRERDFSAELDAALRLIEVIEGSGAELVVPVAVSHAGWVAIELRRRLGAQRVARLAFLDWMVLGAPAPFLDALQGMMNMATTRAVVDQITAMWTAGLEIPALASYVGSMAAVPDEMWARAAREIAAAFDTFGSPLHAVAALDPPPPTLHLYAQPRDDDYLYTQRAFAANHAWFEFARLDAASHSSMFEVPDAIAGLLHDFATEPAATPVTSSSAALRSA